ncbi:MAG: hypothetical protein B7C24_12475 [Bacteroidetes bacterium 4572_77]|nr:MAG: hypothetical protein B7C24_12475 [Bacteroidetes bacterium 4572_77]
MGTGNYKGFVHEIKRAIGIAGVGWESVMQALALVYHQEDKNIGQFEREYWNGIYQDNMSWIDLNKIAEDLENKSNQSNTSTGFDSDFEVNYINK